MRQSSRAAIATLAVTVTAASESDARTVSNVQAAIPANGTLLGIDLIPSAVIAGAVYNASASMGSTTTYTSCNVTVTYTHTGKDDKVVIKYAFPSPSDFETRFYVAGGGGYSLSSDATRGLTYGTASGATDTGYHTFDYSYNKGFCGLSDDTKVYTYYKGCFDEERENSTASRIDFYILNFDLSLVISELYYCTATTFSSLGFGFSKRAEGSTTSTTPAQNGTVSAEGVAVAQAIYDGLRNSDNKRAYLSWQIASNPWRCHYYLQQQQQQHWILGTEHFIY
ncbi:hypothetical protein BPOR_0024g00230 [Botrytis porri]|uniref:Carboxylic ester hydrolase n=1 Tax=Botrytis porri TaxID=87229 RepID=A0A4Z1L4F3_9HELO|nr:hypothetical protein BPOR_0024g00230 [Botrytis porri]